MTLIASTATTDGDVLSLPDLPHQRLVSVDNLTPFAVFHCDKMGPGRRFRDIVVVKASYSLTPGRLDGARPGVIAMADSYWDSEDAPRSSVKQAGDLVWGKPSTDVIITGSARVPTPRARWQIGVVVRGRSTLIEHGVEVTGPRHFVHQRRGGWTVSEPKPTREVPIRYELAYGGSYRDRDGEHEACASNPSGLGFFDRTALDETRRYPAPQWQSPGERVTGPNAHVMPTGLGPIARLWASRISFAGTYDDAWERRMRHDARRGLHPDYAADFDPRFFQCAHPALITAEPLRGNEQIRLRGLVDAPEEFVTQLPGVSVRALVGSRPGQKQERRLALDTVVIDLDDARVDLTWRLALEHEEDLRAALLFPQNEGTNT